MKPSKSRAAMFVFLILNFGIFMKDSSPRALIEDVFNKGVENATVPGQLESLVVVPSKPYTFIACNDTEYSTIFAALSIYDFQNSTWKSNGWLALPKGCTILHPRVKGPVFGYAVTKDRSVAWSGREGLISAPFCLNYKDSFNVKSNECDKIKSMDLAIRKNFFELIHRPDSYSRVNKPVLWRIKSQTGMLGH